MAIRVIQGTSTKSYVVHGATLKCSLGTATSTLQMPTGHGVWIREKKEASIADHIPMKNILPFGSCKRAIPPPPCVPATGMKWLNGKEDVLIDEEPALLNTSMLICSCGGVIKITDDGQM